MTPLQTPAQSRLAAPHPAGPSVTEHRRAIGDILDGTDDRLLVITGPCSAHEETAMVEYAHGLAEAAARFADDLLVVVRVYTEKPRTRLGWPGMLLDPGMDGGHDVPGGIARVRAMLSSVAETGLPIAAEFVDPMLTPFTSDLIAWGGIGARTVESPVHRRMASALPMPIGVKNRTDGAVAPAIDAIAAARARQPVVTLDDAGRPVCLDSPGNRHAHLVLRGGETGPNYEGDVIADAAEALAALGAPSRVVVDCSHGNSGKDHRRQPQVASAVAARVADGGRDVAGVMLESFLHEGSQSIGGALRHGVSVTDSCLSLGRTTEVIEELADAARCRLGRTATAGSARS
ncbi:3-deoxy-7-phosphoheptulonate synthase [Stackebrandtia soli]|uniref:3-deoxy-7-phosphoheptulonate synthase n=1 Tax=Stackebrandtia soli TaxID=1892856 RepID=UPI0039EB6D33